jgi:hypothetical protein
MISSRTENLYTRIFTRGRCDKDNFLTNKKRKQHR